MTAWPAARRGGMLAAVATRAERFLLEPVAPRPQAAEPVTRRAVVAVLALAPRCGNTTLARALAVELAKRDPGGAAIASSRGRVPSSALANAAARRLARSIPADEPAAIGRLCVVDAEDPALRDLALDRPAPVVLDVAHGVPPEAALALADVTVLVAIPAVEPALADLVTASLTRRDRVPITVLNRATDPGAWGGRAVVSVGDVRVGARLAIAGRDPSPGLATPVAELTDLIAAGEAR